MSTQKFTPSKLFIVIAFATLIFGCQKSNIISPASSTSSAVISDGESSNQSVTRSMDATGRMKIQLRPGLTDGQDTYTAFWDGDASWANSTGDFAEELAMNSWTISGLNMGTRGFIKFD